MPSAIGIRLDNDLLKKVGNIARAEDEDRSTVIRKLLMRGYRDWIKAKAAEAYIHGDTTMSEAAHRAGLSVWDMARYLVERGFKSSYSVEDLMTEAAGLAKKRRRP